MIVVQNVAKPKTVNIPILTDYPVKDPTKVGQRFWYQGNEWHYLSQPEIDALGWPETAGFPAPVSKSLYYLNSILRNNYTYISNDLYQVNDNSICDTLGYGNMVCNVRSIQFVTLQFGTPKNFHLLTSLQDAGTSVALLFNTSSTTGTKLNALFTQLPATTKVCSIDISQTSNKTACTPSIATAKGYIVIT